MTGWGRTLAGIAAAALLAILVPAGIAAAAPVDDPDTGSAATGTADDLEDDTDADSADAAVAAPADDADQDDEATAADAAEAPGASAPERAHRAWDTHGRPNRLIIVRTGSVDSVEGGRLIREAPRAPGSATLAALAGSVPAGWISPGPPATRLSAAVLLGPKVVLDLRGDGPTVQLAGGPTPADAASIHSGSGQLAVHGITVSSVDPASGRPMGPGVGRPFVSVGPGGRLLATDATFSDLGTPATEPGARPGLGFAAGSNGSLVRTTLLRNSTGLRLNGSSGVRLESVLLAESAADGLVLRGDTGTRLNEVRAEHNAGNGVLVSGPSTDRPITDISTTGNGLFGIAVFGQTAARVAGVSTRADATGGLQLSGGADAAVSGFAAVDQPIGVLAHVGSARVGLEDVHITGGQRGVVVEKTAEGLTLARSRIEGSGIGIAIGGRGVRLQDVRVAGSRSGLRVERGAADVTASALTVAGGQDGVVVAAGTTGVVLRDLVTEGIANNGVRTAGPNTEIVGGRISGGSTGIAADAATTIRGTEIRRVEVGIRARTKEPVAAQEVTVSAGASGIAVEPGGRVVLTDSRVQAAEAVHGTVDMVGRNDLSLPPLNTLGVIGVPLVLLALLLDQLQRFRSRRRRAAPRPAAGNVRQRPPIPGRRRADR